MSKKELKAKMEALEQRIAVLEAQSVPRIVPFDGGHVPYWRIPYDQRGPQCETVTVTATKPDPSVWSVWYSGRDVNPNTFYTLSSSAPIPQPQVS